MTDAELVAKVLEGRTEAFATLVGRYHQGCARLAYRLLGNRQDAEDALQESLLRAYRGLGRYHDREMFRAWLYRILVNQCRTLGGRRSRDGRRFVHDPSATERPSRDWQEASVEIRDAFQTALDTLDPLLREAFLLKHGEGLEYGEIAAITGAGVSALKMRVKRACDALRPRLEEVWRER
jgi:RNA polymerase sigma-70 factor (ECF subfamily)